MRHTLEMKTIAALKNCPMGRGVNFVHARYLKQMQAWGYGCQETSRAWLDVVDVFNLEMVAQ